jgi:hypothetical protein
MSSNRNKESKILLLILGLIVVLIVLGFTIYQFAAATPGKPDCQPDDWRCKEIYRLEEALAKNKLSNDMKRNLTAKLQALYHEATFQAEGIRRLTEMPTEAELARGQLRTPKVTMKPKDRLTGIIERPAVALSQAFIINNAWQELIDSHYITVFAGALSNDPDQGVLVIYDDSNDKYTIYTSPSKDGSFRIVAAENFHLTLETTKQTKVYFDVLHPSFTNTMNIFVEATITPFMFPTATPMTSPTVNSYPTP